MPIISSAISRAYDQLMKPAAQRFSQPASSPSGQMARQFNMAAPFRRSPAVQDLAMQGSEDMNAQAIEEQRRKKLLEAQQRSGIMSAAWLSLSGNQF